MLKVGIIGFGFMGKAHFNAYKQIEGAEVVAVVDVDPDKALKGAAGNIDVGGGPDMTGVKITKQYAVFKRMGVDIVDICLPTYLHDKFAVKALKDGFNVLCEKPMALTPAKCKRMIAARDENPGKLMIAQCIRFWPEWQRIKELKESGKYGKVLSANIRRISPTPRWSWDNWLMDEKRSGGMILDLHVHDVDYVNYAFGRPNSVFAQGFSGHCEETSGIDGVLAHFMYEDGPVVTAEGNWSFDPGFPFSMQFLVKFEKATYTNYPEPKIYLPDGEEETPELLPGDGYLNEMKYFVDCVANDRPVEISTPEESMLAIGIVEKERRSVKNGRPVKV